jgi:hypothetical protein
VVFVVDQGKAHTATYRVLGELGGTLFLDTSLKPGTPVVGEGRAILTEGDAVAAKEIPFPAESASAAPPESPP